MNYVTHNSDSNKWVAVAPYIKCEGTAQLEQVFQDIVDTGGEGIILRDPLSPATKGRSAGYLKHKESTPRFALPAPPHKNALITNYWIRNFVMLRHGLLLVSDCMHGSVNCMYCFFSIVILLQSL